MLFLLKEPTIIVRRIDKTHTRVYALSFFPLKVFLLLPPLFSTPCHSADDVRIIRINDLSDENVR